MAGVQSLSCLTRPDMQKRLVTPERRLSRCMPYMHALLTALSSHCDMQLGHVRINKEYYNEYSKKIVTTKKILGRYKFYLLDNRNNLKSCARIFLHRNEFLSASLE
jgi:hypothetical protein